MRKGRKKYRPTSFVMFNWDLLNSKAYKDLPPSAAKALPYFLGKIKRRPDDPQKYLEEFSFSYTEARRLGFSNGTHYRNISRLIEKGFIDPVSRGGLRSFGFSSNTFRLSQRWKDYDTPEFKRVQSWNTICPEFGKTKALPKLETYNTNNGATDGFKDGVHSQN